MKKAENEIGPIASICLVIGGFAAASGAAWVLGIILGAVVHMFRLGYEIGWKIL